MSQVAQREVLQVWPKQMPDADLWQGIGPELERPRRGNSRLVRNVSQPTLTVFRPEPDLAIGTGVIVCPGGAFHFLMVDKEGSEVARWLNARGVTAFVLNYRLVPTPSDDHAFEQLVADMSQRRADMERVKPMSIADGLQALRTIRQHASDWDIAPDRIGILGFSAGGVVAAGAATGYDGESRPSFAAPIYVAWIDRQSPADAPPLFLAAATDDDMAVQNSLSLYAAWKAAGRAAELHLFGRGGHGFGMNRQGLPSDTWIDRFWDWLMAEGFVPEPARSR